ncbi:hypothetical protein AKO1_000790, partial [Acrasis kona]
LHKQLELAENFRLNKFTNDLIQVKSNTQQLQHEFNNDLSLLQNEMVSLNIKAKSVIECNKWRNDIPGHLRAIDNTFYTAMKDLNSAKFKSYVEVFYSRDHGKEYHLLDRAPVTFLTQPKIMTPPDGHLITNIKIIHAKYGYAQPHPNIQYTIDYCTQEQSESGHVGKEEVEQPDDLIWHEFRQRYKNRVPSIPRELTLSQTRDIIYIVYCHYQNIHGRSIGAITESKQQVMFKALEQFFVMPEIVMKTCYEFLSAVCIYKNKHFDVLEFTKWLEGKSDTALGKMLSFALTTVRRLWTQHVHDPKAPITKANIESIIRFIYNKSSEERITKFVQSFVESDLTAKANDAYYITVINKHFIIMFRDKSELWCREYENTIVSNFRSERLHLHQFVSIGNKIIPDISDHDLTVRFKECCLLRVNSSVQQLHCKRLAQILAEFMWSRVDKRVQEYLKQLYE